MPRFRQTSRTFSERQPEKSGRGDGKGGKWKERDKRGDPEHVQERRHEARRLEPAERVQNAHSKRSAAYSDHVRNEDRHERYYQAPPAVPSERAPSGEKSVGRHERRQRDGHRRRKDDEHHRHDGAREALGPFEADRLDLALEDRNERSRERALPEELARHVGDGERERECALRHARADQPGLENLADKPKDARERRERPDGENIFNGARPLAHFASLHSLGDSRQPL